MPTQLPSLSADRARVLWIRTDAIGDALLASSMLPHVAAGLPGAEIIAVCQQSSADLYASCPHVAGVVAYDRARALSDAGYREALARRLRELRPELVLNSVYSRDSLNDDLALSAGAPLSVAHRGDLTNAEARDKAAADPRYTFLAESPGAWKHELERHRDFLCALGVEAPALAPRVWLTPDDDREADRVLAAHGVDPARAVAFFPAANGAERNYAGFGEALARAFPSEKPTVVAPCGPRDGALVRRAMEGRGFPVVDLSGALSVRQAGALIRRCRLAVGVETGLAHLACAVGTPNVVVVGGGHFGRFMPYSPLTTAVVLPLDCFGCNFRCRLARPHCVADVAPEVLAHAIRSAWERGRSGLRPRLVVQRHGPAGAPLADAARLRAFLPGGPELEVDEPRAAPAAASAAPAAPVQRAPAPRGEAPPEVSIVVATKDRARLLDAMLTSLRRAAGDVRYEVVAIVAPSRDDTLAVLARHGVRRVVHEAEALGPGRHGWPRLYNLGFSLASGRWAMFASDDTVFEDRALERAVAQLRREPDDVAGGILFYRNVRAAPGWDRFGIDYTYGQKLLMNYGLVRLDRFREAGGFDEAYRFYCADGDLCFRLYERGWRLVPLEGCRIVHDNVQDALKSENLGRSDDDIRRYLARWSHLVPTDREPEPRRLLEGSGGGWLARLEAAGVWRPGEPLRLHLGCGERRLPGYVNVDHPPEEHTVQERSGADVHADLTALDFPELTVDEVRLHHVLEHFSRPRALALIARWHRWLRVGGRLHVETPDVLATARALLDPSTAPADKEAALRHAFGSHEASWAYHLDGWHAAKLDRVLRTLGYEPTCRSWTWERAPHLGNVEAIGVKRAHRAREHLLEAADGLLADALVADVPSERRMLEVWRRDLRSA